MVLIRSRLAVPALLVYLYLLAAGAARAQAPTAVYLDHLDNGFQDWGWVTRSYELRQNYCYPRGGVKRREMIRCAKTNCYRGGNG